MFVDFLSDASDVGVGGYSIELSLPGRRIRRIQGNQYRKTILTWIGNFVCESFVCFSVFFLVFCIFYWISRFWVVIDVDVVCFVSFGVFGVE
jgi:hypothetical protein